jgi:hypothetical protein
MTQILGTVFPPDDAGYEALPAGAAPAPLLGSAEGAWERARVIEWGPERFRTRFRALWDSKAFHVRFDAVDDSPWHTMSARDEHLWEEEVVEIFIDADGSGRNYAELEISPANVVCDLRVESPWPSLRSETDWDWEGMTSAVAPYVDRGIRGWTAVARLPWAGPARSIGAPASLSRPRPERPGASTSSVSSGPEGPRAPATGSSWLPGPGRRDRASTTRLPSGR